MNDKPAALVTGGSRGIGRATALALAGAGYRIAITGRDESALEETAAAAAASAAADPADILTIPGDLTGQAFPEKLAAEINRKWGRLDVLVNNAGTALSRPFAETSDDDWDCMMDINARSPFRLTRALLPLLRKTPDTAVVNIGSVVSFKGYELQAAYTASKHALAGWTKVLAREEASNGIRVHLLAPGGVATDLVRGVRPDIDMSDLIRPEEIAEAVLFLVENRRSNAVIDVLDIHRNGKAPFS